MYLGWSSQRFQTVNIEFLVEIETKKFRRLFELDWQVEQIAQTAHALAVHDFRKQVRLQASGDKRDQLGANACGFDPDFSSAGTLLGPASDSDELSGLYTNGAVLSLSFAR
jgi:hypothetical protein